ncbi:hypothetical protein [Hyphomicrobium sp. 2TAF46]|uniref:hypothetical protein n=1 Tax=Hyphomicrobium sp. 2TAF46 TaxID=3233019 RepID=UPI003F90F639
MRWLLVERKPDVVYAALQDIYLAENDTRTHDRGLALTFATREAAEDHRRHLKHRYDWVVMSSGN